MRWIGLVGASLVGCDSGPVVDPQLAEDCNAVCDELVINCELPTYPDLETCREGCLVGAAQGADTERQRACVQLAECDLFALVACDQDFGGQLR